MGLLLYQDKIFSRKEPVGEVGIYPPPSVFIYCFSHPEFGKRDYGFPAVSTYRVPSRSDECFSPALRWLFFAHAHFASSKSSGLNQPVWFTNQTNHSNAFFVLRRYFTSSTVTSSPIATKVVF